MIEIQQKNRPDFLMTIAIQTFTQRTSSVTDNVPFQTEQAQAGD